MMNLKTSIVFGLLPFLFEAQELKNNEFFKEIHVGSNFGSLIRKPFNGQITRSTKGFVTDNPYINLEFTFQFNSRFSLRIPLAYGLGNFDGKVIEGAYLTSHFFETGPDKYEPSNYYVNGPKIDQESIVQQMMCNNRCSETYRYQIRPHFLKYQTGIFPKFNLKNWKKLNLNFTIGANFGLMDKYAISEYASFSSNKNASDTIKSWTKTDQRIEYQTNTFFFVRGESLLGFDVKLSKRFTLNFETGLATRVNRKGKKPDKIYTNLDGQGYNLVLEDYGRPEYEPKINSISFFNSRSERLNNQFYWINRFSLRYQIK